MKSYDSVLKEACREASSFFGITQDIKLEVVNSIEELSRKLKVDITKIPWYAVGFHKGNKVLILSYRLFSKRGHKKSEFKRVILHEVCHIFLKKIIKKEIPVWIAEGLCQYISFGDLNIKPKKYVELKHLRTYKDWYKYDSPYAYCSSFFSYLNKKFGKRKILKFINLLKRFDQKRAFKKAFNEELSLEESRFRKKLNEEAI